MSDKTEFKPCPSKCPYCGGGCCMRILPHTNHHFLCGSWENGKRFERTTDCSVRVERAEADAEFHAELMTLLADNSFSGIGHPMVGAVEQLAKQYTPAEPVKGEG